MIEGTIEYKDGTFLAFHEGTGDNLLYEDREEGYVDYIYYDIYTSFENYIADPYDNIDDGGMVLTREYVQDLSNDEIIARILGMEGVSPDYVETVNINR